MSIAFDFSDATSPDSADADGPASVDVPPPIAVNAVPVASGATGPAPAALVNVCPQYTRADWQWVAMKAAFGESTARDIRDKRAWRVGSGSSFRANNAIIHAVYDYYGALYKRNPSQCIWAGLGRVAGGPFFWPGGKPKWGPMPSGQSWPSAVWSHDVTNDADRWSWMANDIYPTWMGVGESKRAQTVGLSLEKLCAHDWPPGL